MGGESVASSVASSTCSAPNQTDDVKPVSSVVISPVDDSASLPLSVSSSQARESSTCSCEKPVRSSTAIEDEFTNLRNACQPLVPFRSKWWNSDDTDPQEVYYFILRKGNFEALRLYEKTVHRYLRCNTCFQHIKKYQSLQGSNGFFVPREVPDAPSYAQWLNSLYADDKPLTPPFSGDLFFMPGIGATYGTASNWGDNKEFFEHLYTTIGGVPNTDFCGWITLKDRVQVNAAVHKYLPLVDALLRKYARADLRKSLNLMSRLIESVPYADTLNPGISWLLDTIGEPARDYLHQSTDEQFHQCIRAICTMKIQGTSEDPVCTPYHQALNVLDCLESANTAIGLQAILRHRFDPRNYQRKTGELVAGQIAAAEKLLPSFTVELMTMAKLQDLCKDDKGVITKFFVRNPWSEPPSSSSTSTKTSTAVLRDIKGSVMAATKTPQRKTAANFVERAAPEIKPPTTFSELCSGAWSDWQCELSPVHSCEIIHLILPSTIIHLKDGMKFTWSVSRNYQPKSWSCYYDTTQVIELDKRSYNISHIVRAGPNFALIIENMAPLPTTTLGAGCFPEFLSPEFNSKCGRVFEKIGEGLRIQMSYDKIGRHGPYAIGVCYSVTNSNTKALLTPAHVVLSKDGVRLSCFISRA